MADDIVRLGILGPLEARRGDEVVELGARKQRSVLTMLLIGANRVVSLDRLVDAIWGEEPTPTATAALQVYISNLRRALEPDRAARSRSDIIVTQPPGYLLRIPRARFDATHFEDLAADGHRLLVAGDPAQARSVLVDALALWRGPALAEHAFEPFARREADRLEELRAVVMEERLEADVHLGAHSVVVHELEALVAERPMRERSWGLLMLALYRCGRQADALRTYVRVQRILADEVGLAPGPDLRRLEADILAQSPCLDWQPVSRPSHDPGVPEPVEPAPPHADDTTPFVGRTKALTVMKAALARALQGRGVVALVSGEPGIGKTRLVEEVVGRAEPGVATVVWGSTYEGEGAPAFLPWIEVFEALAARDPEGLRAALADGGWELAQVIPSLKAFVGEASHPPPADPAAARFQLFEAATGVLLRLAARRPLVVVLDDVHWADVESVQLAQMVAGRVSTAPMMLIATYRDVDPMPAAALTELLGSAARLRGLERVVLAGLSRSEVAQFLARTTDEDQPDGLATAVWTRTDGNPFFVQEMARLIAAEQASSQPSSGGLSVPRGVRDVIRRRLARLPDATNTLLTVASVAGRAFDLRVVAEAAGVEAQDAVDLVDPAVASGLLVEEEESFGWYAFCHALIQDAVYDELPAMRRPSLHLRVGDALEQIGGKRASPAELAHHFFQAEPVIGPERGVAYALRAAEAAQSALGYETAEAHLRQALALLQRSPATPERDQLELTLWDRLATLLNLTRGVAAPETLEAWARVTELCGPLNERLRELTSLWAVYGSAWAGGRFDEADSISERILAVGTTWSDPAVTAIGLVGRGSSAAFRGGFVAGRRHYGAAKDIAPPDAYIEVIRTDLVATIDCFLAFVLCIVDELEESARLTSEAIDRSRRLDHPYTRAVVLGVTMITKALMGAPADTRRAADELVKLVQDHQLADFTMIDLVQEWADAQDAGDRTAARFAGRELTRPIESAFRVWQPCLFGLMAETARRAGRLHDALSAVDEGLAESRTVGTTYYDAELHRLRGEILAELSPESVDEAVVCITKASALAETQGASLFHRRAEAALRRLRASSRHP